jgi:hypothetical protein
MSNPSSSALSPARADRRLYGEPMRGFGPGGRPLRAGVFNENETRIAAGVTMVLCTAAFACAAFDALYVPVQVLATFLFVDFTLRVMLGLHHSPLGVIGRLLTRRHSPTWVSARPRRFAWSIGMALSLALMLISNGGVHGALPLTILLVLLAMTWSESVHGVCLGCKLHASMVRHGLATRDAAFDVCARGPQRIDTRRSEAQGMSIFPSRKGD